MQRARGAPSGTLALHPISAGSRFDRFGSALGLVALVPLFVALIALTRLDSALSVSSLASPETSPATKLPLAFVPNEGQTDRRVRYYAQSGSFGVYFARDKAVLQFAGKKQGLVLDLRFLGANPKATLEATDRAPGKVNYIAGSDSAKWHTGLATYHQVVYRDLWPNIDMAFRGAAGKLKYEFRLRQGARVGDIRLAYAGAERLSVAAAGSLIVHTPTGIPLSDARPKSFQRASGHRVEVKSRYSLARERQSYGFAVGAYDHARPLVIDPGLAYSTYLGGAGMDAGDSIAVDDAGNAYVTGYTSSTDFPTTPGAYDTGFGGGNGDAYVTKLNATGAGLIYSTFIGGSASDGGGGIALDGQGNAYVAGSTSSTDFPTTPGAYDTTLNGGGDVFLAKLSATGSDLVYSTLLGGTHSGSTADRVYGVVVDGQGDAYVAGSTFSADFPTTAGAYDTTSNGEWDVFVSKLNSAGSTLAYSTLMGAPNFDGASGIALDGNGSAYVTGSTDGGFPVTAGAYDTTFNTGSSVGTSDAFVTKLNPSGSTLVYSSYLGGSDQDGSSAVAVDRHGGAYVTGSTYSADFPTTPGAADPSNGFGDAYAAKLNAAGSGLAYSTFVGGTGLDGGHDIDVDARGNAYVTGQTLSFDFPTTPDAFDTSLGSSGSSDGFLTRVSPTGSSFRYSTYLGGSQTVTAQLPEAGNAVAVDGAGSVYVAGTTPSPDFPTTSGAYDTTYNSTGTTVDAFVAKLGGVGSGPYAVPQSASSLSVSIVPTFIPCGTGGNPTDAEHAAPLAIQSCTPPTPGGVARIGAQFVGSAQLSVQPGDLDQSNGDQADVAIAANLIDVTTSTGLDYNPNASGPDLTLYARLRFTDTDNGPAGTQPGTATDLNFAVPVDCTLTAPANVGSTCAANTSADSVLPGSIKEGRETILQTFRIRIDDSGPNGVPGNGDDRIFAMQGVFTP